MTIIYLGPQYAPTTITHPYSQRFECICCAIRLYAENSSLIDTMSSCDSGMVDGPIETLLKVSTLYLCVL